MIASFLIDFLGDLIERWLSWYEELLRINAIAIEVSHPIASFDFLKNNVASFDCGWRHFTILRGYFPIVFLYFYHGLFILEFIRFVEFETKNKFDYFP